MGIWAVMKSTINNTIGTSEFKPLDRLIAENSVIKSIQHGEFILGTGAPSYTTTITAVNVNKTIVLINASDANITYNISDTSITFNYTGKLTLVRGNWNMIEFK